MRNWLICPIFTQKGGGIETKLGQIRKAPKKEYDNFRKYFAFACVDLVILDGKSVLLTKRTRNPYKGYWHLLGSMVSVLWIMQEAAKRSAKEELNLKIKIKKPIGVYESLNGFRHDVSHGFLVQVIGGKIKTDFQVMILGFSKLFQKKHYCITN
jgi:ADP-ribose pyrophosphatase YjhB (NUDIX family)